MNKKILTLMMGMMFLFSVVSVQASFMPMPVSGRIDNIPKGMIITMTGRNMRTEDILSVTVGGQYFILECANFPKGVIAGDTVEFKILECADKGQCVKQVQLWGDPVTLNFDLVGLPDIIPVCPDCPEDVTPYAECNSCCPDPEECLDECEPCPVTIEEYHNALYAAGGIGIISIAYYLYKFRFGKGDIREEELKKYLKEHITDYTGARITKWNGKIFISHYHPRAFGGRKDWHTPVTKHKKDSHEGGKWIV